MTSDFFPAAGGVEPIHEGFTCAHCHRAVSLDAPGTRHRNHCPHCLWSVHVDNKPGDRAAHCGAPMEPVAIAADARSEWMLVHRCSRCKVLHINRTAGDDSEYALLSLVVRPLAYPPFPLDWLGLRKL